MFSHIVGNIYTKSVPFRKLIIGVTTIFIAACCFISSLLIVKEDIRSLLPTHPANIAKQFSLLTSAPFMRYSMVTVSNNGKNPIPIIAQLEQKLDEQGIAVCKNTQPAISSATIISALQLMPSLLPQSLYANKLPHLIYKEAEKTLQQYKVQLTSLRSIPFRDAISNDPFAIHTLLKANLESIKPAAQTQLKDGYILSTDGTHGMLMVSPEAFMSDSTLASTFITSLNKAIATLPADVSAIVTGGHRHTYENTLAIQQDLQLVIPLSFAFIIALFVIFLRSWKCLLLLPIPLASLAFASACTGFFFQSISGIVIGFGGVVLGITTDYAVHTYYALQAPVSQREYSLNTLSKPLTLAALTTIISFAILGISTIPVIYQLAVFAITGLFFALLFSLFVFPHFVYTSTEKIESLPPSSQVTQNQYKIFLLAPLWVILMGLGIFLMLHTPMDADIRSLGYQSETLRADEQASKKVWGYMTDGLLLSASAASLEAALQKNDVAYELVSSANVSARITSLAPVLPSLATQQQRHKFWQDFWRHNEQAAIQHLQALAAQYGFAKTAFVPFFNTISAPPPTITFATLQQFGLGMLPAMLISSDAGDYRVYTLLQGITSISQELTSQLQQAGIDIVSPTEFRSELADVSKKEIVLLSTISFLLLGTTTLLLLRSLVKTTVALLPPATSIVAILMHTYCTQTQLNLFNILAFPLVIGLSVDYGIFMVHRVSGQNNVRRAVALSALTTIASFGCLILAKHPALHSLGTTVFWGMSISLTTALFLIPALEKCPSISSHPIFAVTK